MGNGGSHETRHLEDSNWSVIGHGSGAAVGSSTLDRGESFGYGYGYDANLTSVEQGWIVTGGSGSGDGSASYLYDASGVGTYSASFDEGAGTVSGTVSAAQHDGWQYSYHQDYNFDTLAYAWTTTESGSGTADGTSHTDYSGSGSYSTSSSSATLSSSASGGVEESGQTDETYDAKFSWTDNDWTLTEHTGGATLDDYHYWMTITTRAADH